MARNYYGQYLDSDLTRKSPRCSYKRVGWPEVIMSVTLGNPLTITVPGPFNSPYSSQIDRRSRRRINKQCGASVCQRFALPRLILNSKNNEVAGPWRLTGDPLFRTVPFKPKRNFHFTYQRFMQKITSTGYPGEKNFLLWYWVLNILGREHSAQY